MKICSICGREHASMRFNTCYQCRENNSKQIERDKKLEEKTIQQNIQDYQNVIVSTTPSLEGYTIKKYIGIESAEIMAGTSIVKDFFADMSDFFGGRAGGYESSLSNAKQQAFEVLKYKCASLGGNAVVGIDIDYIEVGNKSIMGVVVGGTVVVVEKI